MGIDARWTRWITASVADHIATNAAAIVISGSAAPLPVHVEPIDIFPDDWDNFPHKAEFVIAGPTSLEQNGQFDITVGVLAILSSHRQIRDKYSHIDYLGHLKAILDTCIIVRDYPAVMPVEIGVLTPSDVVPNDADTLRPAESDNLVHSSVEVEYTGPFIP